MASPKTLNIKNLQALGSEKLAELLLDMTADDVDARRCLRMELSAAQNPELLEKEIRKRFSTIARSASYLDYKKIRSLSKDLENQRRMIMKSLASQRPENALGLLWQFMDIAIGALERCSDDPALLIDVFRNVCGDAATVAKQTEPDIEHLAERVLNYILQNSYGQFDELLFVMKDALGSDGLLHLRKKCEAMLAVKEQKSSSKDRTVAGYGLAGPVYQDEIMASHRKFVLEQALIEVADLMGDVDGVIARYTEKQRRFPAISTEIAVRLLEAGRADEALVFLDNAEHRPEGYEPYLDGFAWANVRIRVLDATGQKEKAQDMRWWCFDQFMSVEHLKEYLAKLPDFDDIEVEEKALERVMGDPDCHGALAFFLLWPDMERSSRLVLLKDQFLDGNDYELLTAAADLLDEKYPLAATIVLRKMIDFTLTGGKSARYYYAAQHLGECASLAKRIDDYCGRVPHEEYVQNLKNAHPRKVAFWEKVV